MKWKFIYLSVLAGILLSVSGCTFSGNTSPVSVYYLELNGWENTGKSQFLMNEVRKRLGSRNYYLNTKNEISEINRSSYVEPDSIHGLQKNVHRLEFVRPNRKYNPDDTLIRIDFIDENSPDVIHFEAEELTFRQQEGWISVRKFDQREILHLGNKSEIALVEDISMTLAGLSFGF